MITSTLHFEITGNDATQLLQACQQLGIQPAQALQRFINYLKSTPTSALAPEFSKENSLVTMSIHDEIRAKKLARAGGLARFANPDLIPLEDQAVTMALKAKYGTH